MQQITHQEIIKSLNTINKEAQIRILSKITKPLEVGNLSKLQKYFKTILPHLHSDVQIFFHQHLQNLKNKQMHVLFKSQMSDVFDYIYAINNYQSLMNEMHEALKGFLEKNQYYTERRYSDNFIENYKQSLNDFIFQYTQLIQNYLKTYKISDDKIIEFQYTELEMFLKNHPSPFTGYERFFNNMSKTFINSLEKQKTDLFMQAITFLSDMSNDMKERYMTEYVLPHANDEVKLALLPIAKDLGHNKTEFLPQNRDDTKRLVNKLLHKDIHFERSVQSIILLFKEIQMNSTTKRYIISRINNSPYIFNLHLEHRKFLVDIMIYILQTNQDYWQNMRNVMQLAIKELKILHIKKDTDGTLNVQNGLRYIKLHNFILNFFPKITTEDQELFLRKFGKKLPFFVKSELSLIALENDDCSHLSRFLREIMWYCIDKHCNEENVDRYINVLKKYKNFLLISHTLKILFVSTKNVKLQTFGVTMLDEIKNSSQDFITQSDLCTLYKRASSDAVRDVIINHICTYNSRYIDRRAVVKHILNHFHELSEQSKNIVCEMLLNQRDYDYILNQEVKFLLSHKYSYIVEKIDNICEIANRVNNIKTMLSENVFGFDMEYEKRHPNQEVSNILSQFGDFPSEDKNTTLITLKLSIKNDSSFIASFKYQVFKIFKDSKNLLGNNKVLNVYKILKKSPELKCFMIQECHSLKQKLHVIEKIKFYQTTLYLFSSYSPEKKQDIMKRLEKSIPEINPSNKHSSEAGRHFILLIENIIKTNNIAHINNTLEITHRSPKIKKFLDDHKIDFSPNYCEAPIEGYAQFITKNFKSIDGNIKF